MDEVHDSEDWACLTPWTDADGRALRFEQRMQHCAKVLARYNDKALESVREQIEQYPDLTPELRQAMLRATTEYLISNTAAMLQRIGTDLELEHAAGPFSVRSTEVH